MDLKHAVDSIFKTHGHITVKLSRSVEATVYLTPKQDTFKTGDPDERPIVSDVVTVYTRSLRLANAVCDEFSNECTDWTTDERGLHRVDIYFDARTINDYELEVCA